MKPRTVNKIPNIVREKIRPSMEYLKLFSKINFIFSSDNILKLLIASFVKVSNANNRYKKIIRTKGPKYTAIFLNLLTL